jgi:hypothetical protein
VRIQDSRRHKLKGEGFIVNDDSVPRIVAALVANDHIHVTSQEVGQFAFAFVTPLGSDYDGCGHWAPSRMASLHVKPTVVKMTLRHPSPTRAWQLGLPLPFNCSNVTVGE